MRKKARNEMRKEMRNEMRKEMKKEMRWRPNEGDEVGGRRRTPERGACT